YRALYGVGPYRYSINFEGLQPDDVDSIEENIVGVRAKDWQTKYSTFEQQLQARIVPLTALKGAADFMEWRDAILKAVAPAEHGELSGTLLSLYKALLGRVDAYKFPSVILEPSLD